MFSMRKVYSYPEFQNESLNAPSSGKSKNNQIASIGIGSNVATLTKKFNKKPALAGNFKLNIYK